MKQRHAKSCEEIDSRRVKIDEERSVIDAKRNAEDIARI